MRQFLVGVMVVALAGCASLGGETPAQKVFAATKTYEIALTAAVGYKRLPVCQPPGVPVCSDREVVKTLQQADNVAAEALRSAQNVVRGGLGETPSSLTIAASWAQEAVQAFLKITNQLKVN